MTVGGHTLSRVTRVHAFGDDALGDLDAVGMTRALARQQVSVGELVEAAIARLQRIQPAVNGLAYDAVVRARAEAAAPRGGFFAGVPSFLKDNVDVAGMPTQQGSDAFVSGPKQVDGDVARMFLATGLIPLGKTQLSEFGFSASAEHPRLGAVRNPWHLDHTAGASSSGSGAFVAAGVVPIAHANDGGGSIRIPAAVNGLVGLKPTRDRLPQEKLTRQMPLRIVANGVLTRSVRDTAAFLREAEKIYRNLALPPVGDVTGPAKRRLRVAVLTRSLNTDATPHVAAETLRTAALLEGMGHHVEEVAPPAPAGFPDDFLLYWSMFSLFMQRTGRMSFGRSWDVSRTDNLSRGLARHCATNLRHLPGAIRRLRRQAAASRAFYADWDVLLSPTLAHETPLIGHLDPTQSFETVMGRLLDWVAFTPYQNASGDPAVSLPLATDEKGLPLGMMLAAGAGREATLLELAWELEQAAPWARIQG